MIIKEGDELFFKIKVLTDSILEKMIKVFIKSEAPSLSILNIDYPVIAMEYKRINFKAINFSQRLKIIFKTPTYFASKIHNYPVLFPDPNYFFSNVLKIWNTFNRKYGTIEIENFVKWIKNNVIVLDYRLKTKRVYIEKRNAIKGFVGWIVYGVKDKKWLPWLHVLGHYATLSNVGGNRTAGLGLVEFKPLEDKEDNL